VHLSCNNAPRFIAPNTQGESEMQLHEATMDDIEILITHHRKMFEEIYYLQNITIDPITLQQMNDTYRNKLNRELGESCKAWIIEIGNQIAASGAVSLVSVVPTPEDPVHNTMGYIHSIYTLPSHRKQGAAQFVLEHMLEDCKNNGIKRLQLNTSAAGRKLYERFGFTISDKTMVLNL
jgi:GNAT superfamily N-acetyltransferase